MDKNFIIGVIIGIAGTLIYMDSKTKKCGCKSNLTPLNKDSKSDSNTEKLEVENDCKEAVKLVIKELREKTNMSESELIEREKEEYARCLNLNNYASL